MLFGASKLFAALHLTLKLLVDFEPVHIVKHQVFGAEPSFNDGPKLYRRPWFYKFVSVSENLTSFNVDLCHAD